MPDGGSPLLDAGRLSQPTASGIGLLTSGIRHLRSLIIHQPTQPSPISQ
jgi:hypothetical protein